MRSNFVDLRNRKNFLKKECLHNILRVLENERRINQYHIYYSRQFLQKYFTCRNSRPGLHNYCLLTGRSHSVLRFFRLSRIQVKQQIKLGNLVGVQKASW